jgi:hypothetical protein
MHRLYYASLEDKGGWPLESLDLLTLDGENVDIDLVYV